MMLIHGLLINKFGHFTQCNKFTNTVKTDLKQQLKELWCARAKFDGKLFHSFTELGKKDYLKLFVLELKPDNEWVFMF